MVLTGVILMTVVAGIAAAPPPADGAEAKGVTHRLQWERVADMPLGVLAAGSSRVGRTAVVTGGINQAGIACDAVQFYDLDTDRWRMPLKLKTGRCFHAQLTLSDGRILIAGGQTGKVPGGLRPTNRCEVIDSRAGTVQETAPLLGAAKQPTAHILHDGRAVVIGGQRAAIFNPATNHWDAFVKLRVPRNAHASSLLEDGRVVVVGGEGQATMEVVNPYNGISRMLGAKLPSAMDDLRLAALPGQRVWVIGGQESGTGRTTQKTWILNLTDPDRSVLEPGPDLDLFGGMSDQCLGRVGPWLVAVGGESEREGLDRELAEGRLLDTRTLEVLHLPAMHSPHDDAVSIVVGSDFYIFGGMRMAASAIGQFEIRLPQAQVTVERLRLHVGDP